MMSSALTAKAMSPQKTVVSGISTISTRHCATWADIYSYSSAGPIAWRSSTRMASTSG